MYPKRRKERTRSSFEHESQILFQAFSETTFEGLIALYMRWTQERETDWGRGDEQVGGKITFDEIQFLNALKEG